MDSLSNRTIFTPVASYAVTTLCVYLLPLIVIFGVIGNAISFVILKETALCVSGHFYLICLTVFDTLSLLSMMPTFWVVMLLKPYYQYLESKASWIEEYLMVWYVCQIRMFLTFWLRTLSIYTIVLFSMERCIGILFPHKMQFWCTVRHAKIAVPILIVVTFVVNLPWIFAFDKASITIEERPMEICRGNAVLFVNRMVEFILLCLVPAVVICVCNGLIIKKFRQKHAIDEHTFPACQQPRQVTRRLLAISTAFVLLTFPFLIVITIHTIYEFSGSKSYRRGPLADLFHISFLFFVVNLAVNFIIYCLTAPAFRSSVQAFFCCQHDKRIAQSKALMDKDVPSETGEALPLEVQ